MGIRSLVITRFAKRTSLGTPEAGVLTLIAWTLDTLGAIILLFILGIIGFASGVLPASPLEMAWDSFLKYALALSIIGWAVTIAIDLLTDIGFTHDFDLGEIVFGAFAGNLLGIILAKLGEISLTTLTGQLWLIPAEAFVYFLMKRVIGK